MLNIPAALIPIKNNLNINDPILLFLKMEISTDTFYLVRDLQNQTWDGQTWDSFPFEISALGEADGRTIPSVQLILANPMRIFQSYLEEYDGAAGGTASIYACHAENLASGSDDILFQLIFKMGTAISTSKEITIDLTSDNPWQRRCPGNRIRRNYCRWKFKGTECAYSGGLSTCDKSLQDCQDRSNTSNFGAFPGAGRKLTGLRV